MQLSNYHSHCLFCDGRSTPENFIRFAIAHKFRAYGFSSHSPLPFETNWNMSKDDMPEYLAEIERLKHKYKEQLEIYVGLEIDFLDQTYNASIPYFRQLPLDYRIGSVHFLPIAQPLAERNMVCIDGSFDEFQHSVNLHYGGEIRKLVSHYFTSIQQMIEAGGIDIVGHIDKIYMNGQKCKDFDLNADWYRTPLEDCLHLIAEKGLMVEVNTKNLQKKRELYPHISYLHRLLELQIPILVNSDCHYPDLVNDGREEAFEILRELGFRSTCELINGTWQAVPL